MPEDGSPRPRPLRRALIAIGRAAGLLVLILGINSILAVAVSRLGDLPRYAVSVIAGVTIFELLRPRRRTFPAAVPAPVADEHAAAELAEARLFIEQLRQQSMEREASLRNDSDELMAINEGLRRDVADLAERADMERAAAARLRDQYAAESEHLQNAAGKALEDVQRMRTAADQLRAEMERERQRAAQATHETDTVRKAGEEQRAAATREIEAARIEARKLQQRADQAVNDLDTLMKAAEAQRSTARQEAEKLRTESQRERQRADQHQNELEALTKSAVAERTAVGQESEKLRGESQRERQRADQAVRELQNALSAAAAVATQRQKLESQMADFDRRIASAMQELVALREDRQRALREVDETRRRADAEKEELQSSLEAAANSRVAEVVNKLTTEREAAVCQVREEMQTLTGTLEEERRRAAEIAAQRAGLETELAGLRASSAAEQKTLRESMEAEWSAKLNKIATELATDHENDMGEAIAAREAARAEARELVGRVQELQAENERLKQQIASVPSVDEKALRKSVDAEWSAKLQTIVNHMASDHESDIGKAIEEREAARAETRTMAGRITSLQTKLRQAELEIASLRSSPPATSPPATEPPTTSADELRARAEVLQFAEHAQAVIQATSPGTVPLPVERRPRVLFVHHDPAMRTLWRDNLDQSGFQVQTASDGLEGLRLTMSGKPDVVVADTSMPKMGGHELCQLIKSNQETSGVKVILMTGVYTSEVPLEPASHEFEADELLRKPVKFETLKAALSNLLAAV